MLILEQLESDYTTALKNKAQTAVLVVRQLKTALKNAEIANNRQALSEEDVVKILRTEVKKRKESIDLYRQGGRIELADQEQQEIDLIDKYLPAQMDEAMIRQKVEEVIKATGAAGLQDLGKVMGAAMKELGGQADGSLVGQIVKEKLS